MNNDDLICYDGALGRMLPTDKTGEYVWQRQPRPAPLVADADLDFEIEPDDDSTPQA